MPKPFIGVRWWLGVAFAVVAATSTAIVVAQFSNRSENAFRAHGERLALARRPSGRAAERHAGHAEQLARTQQGLRLALFGPTGAPSTASALEREAVTAALAGGSDVQPRGRADGGVVRRRRSRTTARRSSRSAGCRTSAEAIDTVNGEALRAGVIAGVIGVIVGLLLAQLIALRLRRLTAAAEAIAQRRLRDAAALPLPRRVRAARAELRPDAPPAAPLVPPARGRARPPAAPARAACTRECSRSTRISSSTSRTPRRADCSAADCAEGDALPEPWQGFELREFAQRLFDERASVTQVHVTPDEQPRVRRRRDPVPARDRLGAARHRRPHRAGAARARRARVRLERRARAAHAADDDHRRGRGAPGGREGGSRRARPLPRATSSASRAGWRGSRGRCSRSRARTRGTEAPRVEAVAVAPLLREIAAELRPHDGVSIDVEAPDELAVESNPDLLEQALRNLGENAAKHTARGSVVLRAYRAATR